jgi:hypothetical protein
MNKNHADGRAAENFAAENAQALESMARFVAQQKEQAQTYTDRGVPFFAAGCGVQTAKPERAMSSNSDQIVAEPDAPVSDVGCAVNSLGYTVEELHGVASLVIQRLQNAGVMSDFVDLKDTPSENIPTQEQCGLSRELRRKVANVDFASQRLRAMLDALQL